jgi:flagellar hook-associated protein 1 FlgK
MSGLLGSLQSARSGMNVSQTAIQTTSHNINNMNTPGYSRQKIEQSASSAYSYPGYNSSLGAGQLGTGVQANDVVRIRNTFYDFQFRNESHAYGDISVKHDYYTNMENVFNEPSDTSISSALNEFFNGWHELSKDPESIGAKNIVIENSKYLADNVNRVYEKLGNLNDNLNKQTENILNDVNSMLEQLNDLDKNIKIVEGSGKSPNDLLDQRDKILDELSFKIDINDTTVQEAIKDGKIELSELTGKDVSGELGACMDMSNEIKSCKKNMEDLMDGIANGVNDIYDPTGVEKIFVIEGATGDKSIKVNQDLLDNPSSLKITSDKALELYNFKSKKVDVNGEMISVNNYYNGVVQKLGQSTQEVIRNEKNQSKLLLNIDNSRTSVSGVSMDEEMINLMQFQHAYSASAKVVSTIDSLLDVVINGLVR